MSGELERGKMGLLCDNTKWNECIPIGAVVILIRRIVQVMTPEEKIKREDYTSIMNFCDVYKFLYEHKTSVLRERNRFCTTLHEDLTSSEGLIQISSTIKAKEIEHALVNIAHCSYIITILLIAQAICIIVYFF